MFLKIFLYFSYDATKTESLGRYVNDSKYANCIMERIMLKGKPYLCLFAKEDLEDGIELRYSYNDKPKNLWWRKNVSNLKTTFQFFFLWFVTCIAALNIDMFSANFLLALWYTQQ